MLTVPEAAKIAGKNPETIRRWIRSGRLPARAFGGQHAIDPDDLDAVLHGDTAYGLSAGVDPQVRAALDWALQLVREERHAAP
jgi:excisionase family DNA binding protein